MVDGFGAHAANETEFVGECADGGQHFTEPHAAVAAGAKGADSWQAGPFGVSGGHGGESGGAADGVWDVLSGELFHGGFFVEQIDMRGSTTLPEHDDAAGFGSDCGEAWESAFGGVGDGSRGGVFEQQ